MNEKALHEFNLNLLVVFVVLMRERSATRAAKKLSRTQPAVSHSLKCLRAMLGDDLFTRVNGGMAPTSIAQTFYNDLVPSLDTIERALAKLLSEKPKLLQGRRGRFRCR
jgi:DNA-binding transcriptional LysR family regulator